MESIKKTIQHPTKRRKDRDRLIKELQILKPLEVAQILNISLQSLYRWHQEGRVPIEKKRLGPNSVGYKASDVAQWINGELEAEADEERA